jgi:hypothetical protein
LESLATLATAHLVLRLQPINRAVRAAIEKQKIAAARLARPDLSPLCITEEHVQSLLDQVDATQSSDDRSAAPALLSSAEQNAEEGLRAQCDASGATLPLDHLSQALRLTPFEQEAVLLCAAPELDRTYERIYAFILDDLNRRFPCVELLVSLTAGSIEEQIIRRHALARSGRLRRNRVLLPLGDPPPTDLRQEFRLAPDVFDFLTGAHLDVSCFCRDRAEIAVPAAIEPPPQISEDEFVHLSEALATGRVLVLGIWGPRQNGGEELVMSLAAATRRPLRQISIPDLDQSGSGLAHALDDQVKTASALQACLWLETDALVDAGRERVQHTLAEALANTPVPILLTGEHPWRPSLLVRTGAYAEVELSPPLFEAREKLWSQSLPELEKNEIERLATRYALSCADIRSVSGLARTRARLSGNGKAEPVRDHVAAACDVVTRRSTSHFATVVRPKRGPDDLILPANLHQQITEVATFFQLQSRVDEEWGFGRLMGGNGMKALFTGDPGTGKTLAAEVIASLLGLVLYKVDLARVVSKWVGETEKNLEAAFREAEESHAVLFFDEADALFGKRAEVQHGTDRYANLEVSYLLQRLENSRGLVVLASNVKDQIDAAFIRRFQVVMHFPRPGLPERRRLWQLAVPKSAPVDAELDLEALARLEMTGAAIVTSARTAALLAADAGSQAITMAHMIRATARQFRREARLLTPSELGSYGVLLQGAS